MSTNRLTATIVNPQKRGKAATIKVGTVTQSKAGGTVTFENVGTENDAVFNITLPVDLTDELADIAEAIKDAGDVKTASESLNSQMATALINAGSATASALEWAGKAESATGDAITAKNDANTATNRANAISETLETRLANGRFSDVYFGSDEPPEWADIWVLPDGVPSITKPTGTSILCYDYTAMNTSKIEVSGKIMRNKADSALDFGLKVAVNDGQSLSATYLILKLPYWNNRYQPSSSSSNVELKIRGTIRRASDGSVIKTKLYMKPNGSLYAGMNLNDGDILYIDGREYCGRTQDPLICNHLFPASIAETICNYAENEVTEGSHEYHNTEDSNRYDCSYHVSQCYKSAGLAFQSTVQPAMMAGCQMVASAPKGEFLDVSQGKPGDLIIFERVETDGTHEDYTHVVLYLGNNEFSEMTNVARTRLNEGCVPKHLATSEIQNDYGPYTWIGADRCGIKLRNRYLVRAL